MRYLLAILFPPIAAFTYGRPMDFLLNIALTLFFFVPGSIHAVFIVKNYMDHIKDTEISITIEKKDNKRNKRKRDKKGRFI